MRILVIIYEYPPVGGGGGHAAHDICRGLVKLGHEVQTLTAHLKGLPRQEEIDGFKVIRVPSARRQAYKADLLAMGGFVVSGSLAGLRQAKGWQPDIIHVHFAVPSGPVAWVLSRLTGIPYVLTAHLGDVPGGVPDKTANWFPWFYPFTPQIWRDAERTVAVSEYTRQIALKHYPVDIQVIPNGVDTELLDPGNIVAGDPPQIVFAGRFVSQKNPLQIIRVLAKLQNLSWSCTMIGDGPLKSQVEDEIRSHGMEQRILLPGWVTPEEVIDQFRKSDILFMPSLSEGLPVAGVQALSLGLAFVVSPAGGFVDLVDPEQNGFLIDSDDEQGYCNAFQQLLSSPEQLQSFREASRKKASEFDIKRVVSRYEQLFLEVINGNKKT